jgi:predicted ATPase/DNA-binding SARP family transcriptional activator
MAVRLRLLGSPALEWEGKSYPLPFERRSQLLAYLALKRAWVGRAELASLLWPDVGDKLAYTNLRKTIFRLRSLPWAPEVRSEGGALRFDAATDVADFEAALRGNRAEEASRLRRGEFLDGFDDDASEAWSSWLGFERERLRTAWRGALVGRLGEAIEPAEGLELSARLLEADPLDEAAMRAQMAFLARDGRSAQARQIYGDFVARLAQELGLPPPADLKALHDSLAASAVSAIAPPAAMPVPSNDGFVGRSVELRQVASLLSQSDCRLVTVVGPGGVGKTRLVQRALGELASAYADGAVFVSLEDAGVASDITSRMARELGVPLAGRRDPLGEVIEFLRTRQMLLVLDNFEQLAAEASILGKLLDGCPGIKLIVTSRARLGLPMEQLLPLDGLPTPDIEDQDRFESFDAVRLFVKAARRVEPGLVPEAEAAAIADICRQVDGLPLAIELAASWSRVLSCEAIAAQLRDGLQLLRSPDASRPARHSSMQVVFDESWRHLGGAERDALARLSVFEGGFSAETARSVAHASLPVLAALIDKSLLRKDGARLHLHPLLHQHAGARLEESEARDAAHRSHALHFHRLMAQLRKGAIEGDPETLSTLDREFSNCRRAWRWAGAHGFGPAITGSALTLMQFCDHRFRLEEGLALLDEAIESPTVRADTGVEALVTSAAAHFKYRLDRYPQAEADARRALATTEAGSHYETRLQCFKVLGGCCLRTGRLDEAKHWFREAYRLGHSPGMLDNISIVEKTQGNYDEALKLATQSLVQHRLIKDLAGEALTLNNLGTLYVDRREYGPARTYLAEALALCERHGFTNTRAMVLANLVELDVNTDELDAAAAHARESLEMSLATGSVAVASWIRLQMSRLAVRRGDLATARSDLAAGLEIAIGIGRRNLQFTALSCFAEILEAQGEGRCARSVLAFCVEHPDITSQERNQMRARISASSEPIAPWPGIALDDLLHRLVAERDVSHAPLVAMIGRTN